MGVLNVAFCEHCGTVSKSYPDPYDGTSWCWACMTANGYPVEDPVTWKKMTPKTLAAVMARLTVLILNDVPESQKQWCTDLNKFLDDIADNDGFGTEGQCDPRGDPRI